MFDNGAKPAKAAASAGNRYLFLLAGHLSLAVGVIGLLIPVMPTSPFVIIAAACYARSSERFYQMLLNNKHFGEDIRRWRERGCVRRRLKALSAVSLTVAFAFTVALIIEPLWARWTVGTLGFLAVVAVLCLPMCDE